MKLSACRWLLVLIALLPSAFAQEDVVMKAMGDELDRSVAKLSLPSLDKPYFIAYRVDDANDVAISATLGALTGSVSNRSRVLTLEVRVGSYALDNTNFLTASSMQFGGGRLLSRQILPLDDDYDQIRRSIWLATDRAYKAAAEELARKRSVLEQRRSSAMLTDFTQQPAVTLRENPVPISVNTADLEKLARDLSAVFRDSPDILGSSAAISVRNVFTRYVNSEKTSFTRAEPFVSVTVKAEGKFADGLPLQDSYETYARSPEALNAAELTRNARAMAARMKEARSAAILDRYTGPVLFEGEAACQVVADVFAPGLAAGRFPIFDQPQMESGMQQFFAQFGGVDLADRIGGRVVPDSIDVVDSPSLESFRGIPLLGSRRIDDEGVPSREVKLVEGGILKTLLVTRDPTADFKASTGSRRGLGAMPSNLFFSARKGIKEQELRSQLLKLAKQRGSEYGIVVRRLPIAGLHPLIRLVANMGMPGTGLSSGIDIVMLYQDGHEERIRSVELPQVNIPAFKDIIAAGDTPTVYNGPFIPLLNSIFSGMGSSGLDPQSYQVVSYIAPSLLFEELTLKKISAPAPNAPVASSPVLAGK